MSEKNARPMPWNSACSLIQAQEPLARRFQQAFRLGNHSEATSLANELSRCLHNDIDDGRLTPAASIAYHNIVKKGNWIDASGLANDAADEAIAQFTHNPLKWESYEKFSGYMKRALDWKSRDEVRFHYRHNDGRIDGNWSDEAGDSHVSLNSLLSSDVGTELAYAILEENLKSFVASLPENQKLIATELYLKPDGRSQVELARHLGLSPAWVSEIAKTTRKMIAAYIEGDSGLDQAL